MSANNSQPAVIIRDKFGYNAKIWYESQRLYAGMKKGDGHLTLGVLHFYAPFKGVPDRTALFQSGAESRWIFNGKNSAEWGDFTVKARAAIKNPFQFHFHLAAFR